MCITAAGLPRTNPNPCPVQKEANRYRAEQTDWWRIGVLLTEGWGYLAYGTIREGFTLSNHLCHSFFITVLSLSLTKAEINRQ